MSIQSRFRGMALMLGLSAAACGPTQPSPTAAPPTAVPTQTPAVVPLTVTPPPFTNLLVVDQPAMYAVSVHTYRYTPIEASTTDLALDVYYPASWTPGQQLPAVLFANDFPMSSELGSCGRLCYSYPSWGRLIAANGLITVIYDSDHPSDMEAVAGFIRTHARDLGIDADRLGVMGVSADASRAEAFALEEGHEYVKFLVLYYGYLMTPDDFRRAEFDQVALDVGFYGTELGSIRQLRQDLPTLAVSCGQDTDLNTKSADHFKTLAEEIGMPLTFVSFENGHHVFDVADPSTADVKDEAVRIVEQTLEFMKEHAGL